MSIRFDSQTDVDREKAVRELEDRIAAAVHASRGRPLTADVLDIPFLQQPDKDRKGYYDHLMPYGLSLSVVKNGLVQGVLITAQEQPPQLPDVDDPKAWLRLGIRKLWRPLLKDLGIIQLCRLYEQQIAAVHNNDPIKSGRWTRDAAKAASSCMTTAYQVLPSDAGLLQRVQARGTVAFHVGTSVVPYPAIVANLATCTADIVEAGLDWLHRMYRRRELMAQVKDSNTPAQVRRTAEQQLAAIEQQSPASTELRRGLEFVVRSSLKHTLAVALECVGGAVGTLLWAGWGTAILQVCCAHRPRATAVIRRPLTDLPFADRRRWQRPAHTVSEPLLCHPHAARALERRVLRTPVCSAFRPKLFV